MDGDPRQDPAYRATLLQHRWAEVKSPLTFVIYMCSELSEPIPNLSDFSVRKIGHRTEISDNKQL